MARTGYIVGAILTVLGCSLVAYPIIYTMIQLYGPEPTVRQTGSWVGLIKDALNLKQRSGHKKEGDFTLKDISIVGITTTTTKMDLKRKYFNGYDSAK